MPASRILIFDDKWQQGVGANIKMILERESAYQVDLVEYTHSDINKVFDPLPDLLIPVIPSVKEHPKKILNTLRTGENDIPLLPVIRFEHLNNALDDWLPWVNDFLVAPVRDCEVLARVGRSIRRKEQKNKDFMRDGLDTLGLAQLVGQDQYFLAVKRKISRIAEWESTVLLTGETGTGKEMCARLLHYLSRRAGKPFLPVNCGAIPSEIFERELFGHHKGAFTSAWAAQPGIIAEAEGGTLFLDEIETLDLGSQAKLLRLLQDQTYFVLGSPKLKTANIWIIASTNVELKRKVQEGTFRSDLYYRLAVITLNLPPLRQRQTDIPLLVAHFWKRYAEQHVKYEKKLSPKAMEALCHYSWPGNVRELENVIQQLIVLTEAQTIEPKDLPFLQISSTNVDPKSFKEAKARAIEHFERDFITGLLQTYHGNVTQAAQKASKERRAFGRLIKKYQIEKR